MNLDQLIRAAKGLRIIAEAIAIPDSVSPPLTPGEIAVLGVLVSRPEPFLIGEIVKGSALAQSRVSSAVQMLVKRGWVVSSTPTHDRRSTLAHAKPEVAEATRKALGREVTSEIAELLRTASPTELKTIEQGLIALVNVLDREKGKAKARAKVSPRGRP